MVKEINEKEFYEVIKSGRVVIDFFAVWCGPCKMLSPIMDEISSEITNISFYKINVDDNQSVSMEYNIMSIPTLVVFNEGKVEKTIVGLHSKSELMELLK